MFEDTSHSFLLLVYPQTHSPLLRTLMAIKQGDHQTGLIHVCLAVKKVDGKRILTFLDKIDGIAPVYVTLKL